ncbi:MAG: hypothetical protein RLZZ184_265 [Cyanobacteriota bacterium]|jgi:hypothetical protein
MSLIQENGLIISKGGYIVFYPVYPLILDILILKISSLITHYLTNCIAELKNC